MTRALSWQAAEPSALAWREWDDEFVVYNEVTGSTHHLSTLGGQVLVALLGHPCGTEVALLVREIATHVETPEPMTLLAEVEGALAQLVELRLVACNSA